jgi:hypothetical protein
MQLPADRSSAGSSTAPQVHVSKWLKKLEQLTYGSWVAYDIALAGGWGTLLCGLISSPRWRFDGG